MKKEEIDEDQIAQDAFDNPAELYRLWKEEGNLLAAQFLGNKHHWGDEENGIFINPDKAREIYEEIGEAYETWENEPEAPDPKTRDYVITGSSEEQACVKLLIDKLSELYGLPENESEICVPVGALIKFLVGSPYYKGIILSVKSESPEKLVVTAELENPHALLYAFREAFLNLKIDMQNVEME